MSIQTQDYTLSAKKFEIPESITHSPGIRFGDHLIKSVLLSTDLSYIQSLHADAVMIMNPFEKSSKLDKVIIDFSNKPVFCDAGGGFLREEQTIQSAKTAFEIGASGVVISKPTSPDIIARIRKEITGKLIYTVMYDGEEVEELADAGVDVFNIATGEYTAESVAKVKELVPNVPVMASGGPYDSTILETIEMGADAIVFNPPTATEILRSVFDEYRHGKR
ncbi:hypothetical protein [Gracilimonas mengyeensis]|uniref:Uncharacterized protein n=1 Tax=Gracilimonas mengyeensis TaxID=1302730 RepID=A0A521BWW5_9BACT|nr:hypothetical protein [Gracilimonas mengyeensis]SMO51658.1 hypothetical protein SAMN06265219_103178 [Gracilimonas mengyeensis]